MSRTLAIGDIHGCSRALDALLAAVSPTPDDLLITLGDYIDRGLDSAGVLDRLVRLSTTHRLVALRGNHEEMMMDARRDESLLELWKRCGGESALVSYAPTEFSPTLDSIPDAHWHFLDHTCLDWFETDTHIFVHGGVEHDFPVAEQHPIKVRWLCFPPRHPHMSGKTVICGHTPQRSGIPATLPHAICIDTAAGFDGWITCLDVATGHYWQANERGQTREAVLPTPKRRW